MNFDDLWIFLRSGWRYQDVDQPSLNLYKAEIKHEYEEKSFFTPSGFVGKRCRKFTIHTCNTYCVVIDDTVQYCKKNEDIVSPDEVYDSIINYKSYKREEKISKLI